MGAATRARLEASGQRVIGVDRRDADVIADLSRPQGRASAIAGVLELTASRIDGIVTWAGLAGLSDVAGSLLVSVNYFGTVELLDGLRPALERGDRPAAVAVSSNSTTCQPGVPIELVDACLEGDEERARALGDQVGALAAYPATKLAVARWSRRHAPTPEWAGAGIALNVVVPGAVETPMLQATRADPTIGQFVDAFPIPVGRPGTADELAGVVEFLLGASARFLCGSVVFADGGTDALLRPDDMPVPMP